MNDMNKRTFTIATCITTYSLIFSSINVINFESLALAIIVRLFLVAAMVVTAFIFVHLVENKVVDKEMKDDE